MAVHKPRVQVLFFGTFKKTIFIFNNFATCGESRSSYHEMVNKEAITSKCLHHLPCIAAQAQMAGAWLASPVCTLLYTWPLKQKESMCPPK